MTEINNNTLATVPQLDSYSAMGFVPIENPKIDLNNPENLDRPSFKNIPHLTEDEAKLALNEYVCSKSCYGKKPIKEMEFTHLESSNIHRYVLQTFTETRLTAYEFEPYFGAPIYITGQPAQPWDIEVRPTSLFKDEVKKIEIPNTAHVENCFGGCYGMGTKKCIACDGRGIRNCWICDETGHVSSKNNSRSRRRHNQESTDICVNCSGTRIAGCNKCHRIGRMQCDCCKGSGKLRKFLQLTVSFLNHESDFLKKSNLIPDDMIRKCKAQNAFSEQSARVYPIKGYSEPVINQVSYSLLNTHLSKFNNCRIVAQRQDIYVIPVTLCTYTWKEKMHSYHIYGLDHSVYCPDYPQTMKCCSVM